MHSDGQVKRTNAIDIVYLSLSGLVVPVTLWAILGAGPDSWFQVEKNQSFALLLCALGVLGILDLVNASTYGKIWVKLTPLYRFEHPRVFAVQTAVDKVVLLACVAGVVALLAVLPPL